MTSLLAKFDAFADRISEFSSIYPLCANEDLESRGIRKALIDNYLFPTTHLTKTSPATHNIHAAEDCWKEFAMYAIAFDLDTDALAESYGKPSHTNAYADIAETLEKHGFKRQQGSVYFGGGNAVSCVLAAQDLAKTYPWFSKSVEDIRMLRIEDDNDLMPAVEQAVS